ncbi:hypothetical protein VPH35_065627 [Triticum aestivum]
MAVPPSHMRPSRVPRRWIRPPLASRTNPRYASPLALSLVDPARNRSRRRHDPRRSRAPRRRRAGLACPGALRLRIHRRSHQIEPGKLPHRRRVFFLCHGGHEDPLDSLALDLLRLHRAARQRYLETTGDPSSTKVLTTPPRLSLQVLVGHPHYEVTGGTILFKGENLIDMEPEERSLAGLFMSFQAPIEIPGVSNYDFLLMAINARREKDGLPALGPLEFYSVVSQKVEALKMEPKILDRNVNEGFSGGERKRNEILQLSVLGADLALLDEIDSGLDVDALEDVAHAVNGLLTPQNSVLMITHYQRLLDLIKPSYVHIMESGKIVKTGDSSLASHINEGGYKSIASFV